MAANLQTKSVNLGCESTGTPLPSMSISLFIIRPHRSATYVDAAYCYRPSSMICHASEPCKNGCTDRDAVCVVVLDDP